MGGLCSCAVLGCLFSTLCSPECLLLLFPCIFSRLDNNQFKDNVMELLGSVLSVKDCQIQKLR